jgi:hypothetical protein
MIRVRLHAGLARKMVISIHEITLYTCWNATMKLEHLYSHSHSEARIIIWFADLLNHTLALFHALLHNLFLSSRLVSFPAALYATYPSAPPTAVINCPSSGASKGSVLQATPLQDLECTACARFHLNRVDIVTSQNLGNCTDAYSNERAGISFPG